jgi:hypothetical protein
MNSENLILEKWDQLFKRYRKPSEAPKNAEPITMKPSPN